ncbi:MAG: hypothetical protein ABIJ08_01870, partial [Nanoarchaeota archaeon]
SSITISAQPTTVYDQITDIISDPSSYTAIIGKLAKPSEIKLASELVGFFDIKKSNFDTKVTSNTDLLIIGVTGNNDKLGQGLTEGYSIRAENNNLIVSGSSTEDLQEAIKIINNYEKNKNRLQGNELSSKDLFSPKGFLSIFLIILGVLAIGGSTTFLLIRNKGMIANILKTEKKRIWPKAEPKQEETDPRFGQLKRYVAGNLRKGYTPSQIKSVLVNAGWDNPTVSKAFDEVIGLHMK